MLGRQLQRGSFVIKVSFLGLFFTGLEKCIKNKTPSCYNAKI